MHVCGNLTEIIDDLLMFPVNVLDLEFSNNPSNLALFNSRDIGKMLIGYGCVDSTTDTVETVDEIKSRIKRGLEIFSPETLLLDPDCGMRMRSRNTAFEKMSHLVEAAKIVRNEIV
jgi:5-methyltetrahydropteroyltriglutamate--homocysteine methyltransferase